jgi:predicted methyltransferase
MIRATQVLVPAMATLVACLAACGPSTSSDESELDPVVQNDAPAKSLQEESSRAIAAALEHEDRIESDIEQDLWRQPQTVLEFMGIEPGMRVLDYFAAAGYFSEIIGRAVGPAGSVTVYNNPAYAAFAGRALADRFTGERVPNAQIVTVPTAELRLTPGSLDAVLFFLAYHDLYWIPEDAKEPMGVPAQVATQLFNALEPGGIILVVDHAADPGGDTAEVVGRLHRIDPDTVRRDFAAAGFTLEAQSDVFRNPRDDHSRLVTDPTVRHNTDRFMFRFRKPLQKI